jgi:Sap, sulfolipid-1-addressing protein
MVQLLAFITGSFAMSTSVGFPVLFVFHHGLFGVTNTDGSKAQIVIGVLILLIAVLLATDVPAGRFTRRPTTPMKPTKPTTPTKPTKPTKPMKPLKKFPTRAQSLLQGGFTVVLGSDGDERGTALR